MSYTTYHDPNSTNRVNHDFDYHAPDSEKQALHGLTRNNLREVAHFFDQFLPPGREKSLAKTKLEEAMFWANAAIARY